MRPYGLSEFNSRLLAAHGPRKSESIFGKDHAQNPKFYNVLCTSKRTRGAVGKNRTGTGIIFRRAKKKAGGRRCRPFPVTSQREEVLAGHPGEQREEVPPAGYSLGPLYLT
jgi:hypothetical protein